MLSSALEIGHTSRVPPNPLPSSANASYKHSPPKTASLCENSHTPLLSVRTFSILTQAQFLQNPTASLCENSRRSTVPPKPRCFSVRKFLKKHNPPKNLAASLCENSYRSTVPPKPRCSPQNPAVSRRKHSYTSTVPPKPRCFSVRKFLYKHSPPKPRCFLCENSHASTVPKTPLRKFLKKQSPPKTPLLSVRTFSHKHSFPKTLLLLCAKILKAQSPQSVKV